MWIDVAAWAVAGLSLLGLAFTVGRYLRLASGIDVSQLPGVSGAQLKRQLLDRRLQRQLRQAGEPVAAAVGGWLSGIYRWAHDGAERLVALEESYRRRLLGKPLADVLTMQRQRQQLIAEAESLAEEEKFAEAERVYLDLIRVDPTGVEAYEGLGSLYYRQRQYDEARQTFEYLAKLQGGAEAGYGGLGLVAAERGDLATAADAYRRSVDANPRAAGNLYNLAKVYEALEDLPAAAAQVGAALQLEPENPRYLDYAATLAILQRDASAAEELVERLATVNPENAKVAQHRQAIAELRSSAA